MPLLVLPALAALALAGLVLILPGGAQAPLQLRVTPNSPYTGGVNAVVVQGGGPVESVAGRIEADGALPVQALWLLAGGSWDYYLPSFPAVSTLDLFPDPASAFAVLDGGGQVVRASDGRAALSMPAGALPAGVNASDIRITPLTGSDAPQVVEGPPLLAAYRLEPSGLQFNLPATLRVEVPAGAAGAVLPLVLNLSNGGVEPAADVAAALDAQRGTLTIQAAIPHFSPVVVTQGFFTLTIDQPTDQLVNTPFHVEARVGASRDTIRLSAAGNSYTVSLSAVDRAGIPVGIRSWFLYGSFSGNNISPLKVADPATSTVIQFAYIAGKDFSCVFPGTTFVVGYIALLRYRYSVTTVQAGGAQQVVNVNAGLADTHKMWVSGAPRQCLVSTPTPQPTAPPPVPPTTPTSSPTATPTPTRTPEPIDVPPGD